MTPSKNQNGLSSSGMDRKDQMLHELQDAMITLHRRRRAQLRLYRSAGVAALLVPVCVWVLMQAFNTFEKPQSLVMESEQGHATHILSKSEYDRQPHDRDRRGQPHSADQANGGRSLSEPAENFPKNRSRKSLIDKYVVTTANIEKREMESIDDAEMLELLKQAGIEGWIAEIDDQQVVLNSDGKRL